MTRAAFVLLCLPLCMAAAAVVPPVGNNRYPGVNGLVAAVFSPFAADGTLNVSVVPAQADVLAATGVRFAYISGTTGESLSLTEDERLQLASAWVDAAPDRNLSVIVHVGHNSLPVAQRLAAHAQSIGAYAIAAMPPMFFKPSSVPNLVTTMAAIAASAPQLPFYYYHIPGMTGVDFKMIDFLPAAAAAIPTLNGIKYTSYDLLDFGLCTRYADGKGNNFNMLIGKDEILDAALLMGAEGAVGSTYNYAGTLYNRIITAFVSSDRKSMQQEQTRAQEFIHLMVNASADNRNANKAMMLMKTGVDVGPPRLPQVALDSTQASQLKSALTSIGFFSWA